MLGETVRITTTWTYHALDFIAPTDVDYSDATVAFAVGAYAGRVWLDGLAINELPL